MSFEILVRLSFLVRLEYMVVYISSYLSVEDKEVPRSFDFFLECL